MVGRRAGVRVKGGGGVVVAEAFPQNCSFAYRWTEQVESSSFTLSPIS